MSDTMTLGNEGSTTFGFDKVGDKVRGKVVSMAEVPQTDMDSGEPKFWPDGKPMVMYQVTLQTKLSNGPDDDGKRTVYLRGSVKPESKSSLAAVRVAVKAATGSYNLQIGGDLELAFSGEEASSKKGFNARKLYTGGYWAPSVEVGPADPEPVAATPAAVANPFTGDWDADPRVAPLRAAGVPDDAIRKALGL